MMNKTVSVNLAGEVFNIEENAYYVLEEYIAAFIGYYGKAAVSEKEAKLAAFFRERLGSRTVITYADVEEACNVEGCPPGFNPRNPSGFRKSQTTNSRIFRDKSNGKIGGVCAGLASYFGSDPVIFRAIFLVLFFGAGSGLLLYIILWAIIPEKE